MTNPAGWHDDPQDSSLLRYWDGKQWTSATAPRPAAAESAAPKSSYDRAPAPFQAVGHGGQVQFDGDFITITRKGFIARTGVGKGEKRIPLVSIAAVQWKPAGPLVNGFIQFTVPGGNERRSKFGQQTTNAAQDENSVLFTRGQMPQFEKLRDVIERAIVDRSRPVSHAQPAPAAPPPVSAAEQIAQLAQLHQSGSLSDAEFTAAKAKLLGI